MKKELEGSCVRAASSLVQNWLEEKGGALYSPGTIPSARASHLEKVFDSRPNGGGVMRLLAAIVVGVVALTLAACARSTPTPTSDVEWGGGTGTQVETPSSTPTAMIEAGSDTGTPTQGETTTPTPARAPIVGQSQPVLDRQARDEQRLREVMEEFPQGMKTWIDQDTIVYLRIRDPHDREGELVAVGLDLPTGAVKNYELAIDDNGQAGIALYSERTPDSPEGVSNQQKWDALVGERSSVGWRLGELPEVPVVASSPFGGLSLHLLPAL